MASDIPVYSKQYINGDWVDSTNNTLPDSEKYIDVLDSNTDTVCARVINGSSADTERAIEAASAAFKSWSRTTVQERKGYVQKIIQEYMKRQKDVASALQKELGAPKFLAEKVQSVMFIAHMSTAIQVAEQCEWKEDVGESIIVKEPIGVVGAITPWNWPLNQIGCKLGPALMSGCTVVLKPSEVTPINAYLVAEAIHASGLPKGVFNMVCGKGKACGEILAKHPKVDMVSFTGSTAVGRHLHALGAQQIKRVRTELGGKSAAVILDDATPEQIGLMAGNVLGNTGQSCNALSRMIVPKSRYDECCQIAKATFESVKVTEPGNPNASKIDIGPLSSREQQKKSYWLHSKGYR
uniref:aldehyde dehydrogenase (NAD(+)) n=1 Tax=Aplanochytrium stocchinoi TaxID=215587 RepID=A0A7S3PLH0_9STRA